MTYRLVGLLILVTLLLQPAVRSASATTPDRFTLADLGALDLVLRSTFDREQVHFRLSEGRHFNQGVLKLHVAHGRKVPRGRLDLNIVLNGEPVADLLLTPENAAETTMDVPLPVEGLRHGDNVLTFQFRFQSLGNRCDDTCIGNLWAKVFADSAIEIDGVAEPIPTDLARYPSPFDTASNLPGNIRLSIILPGEPTAAELTSAAQIAAALGQAAGWSAPPIQALTVDQLNGSQVEDHWIVIDTGGRNPLAGGCPPGITLRVAPTNSARLWLVVSGAAATDLLQSAALLSTRSAHPYLAGTFADVRAVSPLFLSEQPAQASFATLGFGDRHVSGIGTHDVYLPIDVPYDWKLTNNAAVQVQFTHARTLSAASSVMSAYVNGRKVVDVPLTARNATDGRLVVQLAPRQVQPGRNWLHLAFDLRMRTEDCPAGCRDEAWAGISAAASTLNLAHVTSEPPRELRYLVPLLLTPLDMSADVFVLPSRPSPADLTTMVRVAAKLGTYSTADGVRPRALTADQFSPGAGAPERVIAIGQPDSNSLLAGVDAQLPQPLQRIDGQIVPTGGRELTAPEMSAQAAYLQILPAPWPSQATLVVLSAFDGTALLRLVDWLPTLGHRIRVKGNVAVVTPDTAIGLTIGGLAGIPLSESARRLVLVILIGTVAVVVGIGAVLARRKRNGGEETAYDAEE